MCKIRFIDNVKTNEITPLFIITIGFMSTLSSKINLFSFFSLLFIMPAIFFFIEIRDQIKIRDVKYLYYNLISYILIYIFSEVHFYSVIGENNFVLFVSLNIITGLLFAYLLKRKISKMYFKNDVQLDYLSEKNSVVFNLNDLNFNNNEILSKKQNVNVAAIGSTVGLILASLSLKNGGIDFLITHAGTIVMIILLYIPFMIFMLEIIFYKKIISPKIEKIRCNE